MLVSYRRELVEDRTAQSNRLHADLGKLRPGYHQIIPRFTTRKAFDQAMKLLWRDTTPHGRVAKQRIRRLRTTGHRDQTTHHRDQNYGRPIRNPTTRHSRGGCAGGCHHPFGGGQPPPLCDQRQVRHGQRHRTHRSQLWAGGATSPQPRLGTANSTGQSTPPHSPRSPAQTAKGRRYYQKTQNPRENPQRSPTRPQKTNLRPRLDPPPTTKTSPEFDIGAHPLGVNTRCRVGLSPSC